MTATAKPVSERILNWLRAGYPKGIPREDYIALFAVLHRRLTETEVRLIADRLIADATESGEGEIDRTEIEAAIEKLALETPGDEDVARVASRLAAGGWPLADPAE